MGTRGDGTTIEGAQAACVNCHRRSGLGGAEGHIIIPPIIAPYLFRPLEVNVRDPTTPHVPGFIPHHGPYTATTFMRVVRAGLDPDGKPLGALMPRFDLDDTTLRQMIDYLDALARHDARGVEPHALHFASIVAADADPAASRRMIAILEQFFADQNDGAHRYFDGKYRGEPPVLSGVEQTYNTRRKWILHVWRLRGAPDTWSMQLRTLLKNEPVFATVSGMGGADWRPVHEFCEQNELPCLFPNVLAPEVAPGDFYPLYFSAGVSLEARLMAQRIRAEHVRGQVDRVVQIHTGVAAAEAAVRALDKELAHTNIETAVRSVRPQTGTFQAAWPSSDVADRSAVILWLSPQELAGLPPPPGKAALVLASGLLGGLEDAPLSSAWRSSVHVTYPFDLPEARALRMRLPLEWLRLHHIEIVDERIQTDTYLACVILARTLDRMLDSFLPDYLIERVEDSLGNRTSNGYYPHLGLARDQRFASRGGYIAHFTASGILAADGEWSAP